MFSQTVALRGRRGLRGRDAWGAAKQKVGQEQEQGNVWWKGNCYFGKFYC